MTLLTESEVLSRASRMKSAALESLAKAAPVDTTFDVFLSHSSNEPEEIVFGIKGYLEDAGLSVYLDCEADPQLSPERVTRDTAKILRSRLRASQSLLYVYSRHSKLSRWMPWELGFMDGASRSVGIAPVMQTASDTFDREEYLNLYPYLDRAAIKGQDTQSLWINNSSAEYANYVDWIRGNAKITKRIA